MTTIAIEIADEAAETLLRARAAHHQRTLEDEARELLYHALRHPPVPERGLHTYLHQVCGPLDDGGIETPARTLWQPPDLEG